MNQSVYESADINQVENEQKLRSEGKLLNDMITYNEQEQYYGEGQNNEQTQEQIYNNEEEGLAQQQNDYDYGQQQTDN